MDRLSDHARDSLPERFVTRAGPVFLAAQVDQLDGAKGGISGFVSLSHAMLQRDRTEPDWIQ